MMGKVKHKQAKPFLKWAGGKTQLISEISAKIPYKKSESFTYVEPFVGSGAVLFWMLKNYQNLNKVIINDVNFDLTNCYLSIRDNLMSLIAILEKWQAEYWEVSADTEKKKEYYYEKRVKFNARSSDTITQSALFIFLNRTCFNGLYRVNKNNYFNVPIGSYKKPTICDTENLILVSSALQKVVILNGDYSETMKEIGDATFFYLDPPYKPLSKTSSFNSYADGVFDDMEQIRLKEFCQTLDESDCRWVLSNSDVKSVDSSNEFFDNLYSDYSISRIFAKRMINASSSKRGYVGEILVTNT